MTGRNTAGISCLQQWKFPRDLETGIRLTPCGESDSGAISPWGDGNQHDNVTAPVVACGDA